MTDSGCGIQIVAPWQPIETAPIGVNLLLWWRPAADPRYPHPPECASELSNNKYAEGVVIGTVVDPNDDSKPSQWWNGQAGRYQAIWHVTHWMHLPPPPKL